MMWKQYKNSIRQNQSSWLLVRWLVVCVVVRLEFAIIAGGLLGLVALVLVGLCQPKATKQGRATVTHISKVLLLGWAGGRAAAPTLSHMRITAAQANKQTARAKQQSYIKLVCSCSLFRPRRSSQQHCSSRSSLLAVFLGEKKNFVWKNKPTKHSTNAFNQIYYFKTHVADDQNITEASLRWLYA